MKAIKSLLLLWCITIAHTLTANQYAIIEKAVRESDDILLKQMKKSLSVEKDDQYKLICLANDIIAQKKAAIDYRKFTVDLSIALKLAGPFTVFSSFAIGSYLDPRGLGALGAIVTGMIAVNILSLPKNHFDKEFTEAVSNEITYASLVAAVGFLIIEKHLWKRAADFDEKLQQDYDKAIACKALLIRKFDLPD
jgi:hypothetical protein